MIALQPPTIEFTGCWQNHQTTMIVLTPSWALFPNCLSTILTPLIHNQRLERMSIKTSWHANFVYHSTPSQDPCSFLQSAKFANQSKKQQVQITEFCASMWPDIAQDESDDAGSLDDWDISDNSAQSYLNLFDQAGINGRKERWWLLMKALGPRGHREFSHFEAF